MENYEKIFKKYKDYYFSLKPVRCTLLANKMVHFTNSGFNHILRKKRKERNKSDQIRRFLLLDKLRSMIEKADILFERRFVGRVIFWSIGRVGYPKVVVCKNTKGPIYFVSIIP